jgi:hypothetical protein
VLFGAGNSAGWKLDFERIVAGGEGQKTGKNSEDMEKVGS